jgi:hypothetical protein
MIYKLIETIPFATELHFLDDNGPENRLHYTRQGYYHVYIIYYKILLPPTLTNNLQITAREILY